jgi:peroxiredoxin
VSFPFYLSYAALWVLVVLHSLLLLGVVRLVYQSHRAGGAADSEEVGLKSGQRAPDFSAVDLSGAPVDSVDYAGRMRALLFVSPNCPSCTATLYEMDALNHKTQGNVVVVCRAEHQDCARLAVTHKLRVRTIVDEDERISRLFGVSSNPTAVLINERDRIQSYGHPMRGEELEALLDPPSEPRILRVG